MSDLILHDSGELAGKFIPITRSGLLAAFSAWLHQKGKSEATRITYLLRVGKFLDWLGGRSWQGVTPQDVVIWRDELANLYSPMTVALHLTAGRRFYSFLIEGEYLTVNPFREVDAPKRRNGARRKKDTITRAEWQRLMDTCKDSPAGIRDRAILTLAYELGLREVEIVRAEVGDLGMMQGAPVLHLQGKGEIDKSEFMVIPESVEAVLSAWLGVRGETPGSLFTGLGNRSKGGITESTIRAIWKEHKQQAGIFGERKTFHSLRHTAIDSRARYAVKHGKSPFLVQTFARHKSLDTTMQYIHDVGRMDDPPELWGTNTNGNGNGG